MAWDAKCKLGDIHNAAFEFLLEHSSSKFSTFEIEAPPRGQLASELAAFHRAGLLAKNTSVKPSQETDVVAASRAHMANAKESWEACNEVETKLKEVVTELNTLLDKHRFVTEKTRTMREACETLVAEKQALVEYHQQLCEHTQHFAQLETATALVNKPNHARASNSMTEGQLQTSLANIEAAVIYFEGHPDVKDVEAHLSMLRNAVMRSVTALRDSIVSQFQTATKKVNQEIHSDMAAKGGAVDTAITVVHFQTLAPQLQPCIAMIESRQAVPEANGLLMDIHENYMASRETVLYPMAKAYISNLSSDLPAMLRSACPYLLRICNDELKLLQHFFTTIGPASATHAFRRLLECLWGVLHDVVRPMIIKELSLDMLCEVVDVLKFEVLEDQVRRRAGTSELVEPIVMRLMQDAQERLIYRTQAHVVDAIGAYYPKPDDLDYPKRMEGNDPRDTRSYFPTLDITLSLLSKVYQCLERSVFEGIASEAVSLCTASFVSASKTITRKCGPIDGNLFLIQHLYMLREQIAPFESDFTVDQNDLDLGYLGASLSTMLSRTSGGSIFSLSANNPLFSAVRTVHHTLNPKQDLEKELRQACEALILEITKQVAGPIIQFLGKAPKVGIKPGTENQVAEAIEAARNNLETVLRPALGQMAMYLQPWGHLLQTMIDPIHANIEETTHRLHNHVTGPHTDPSQVPPLPANFQTLIALAKAMDLNTLRVPTPTNITAVPPQPIEVMVPPEPPPAPSAPPPIGAPRAPPPPIVTSPGPSSPPSTRSSPDSLPAPSPASTALRVDAIVDSLTPASSPVPPPPPPAQSPKQLPPPPRQQPPSYHPPPQQRAPPPPTRSPRPPPGPPSPAPPPPPRAPPPPPPPR